jgi:hypothetical protein
MGSAILAMAIDRSAEIGWSGIPGLDHDVSMGYVYFHVIVPLLLMRNALSNYIYGSTLSHGNDGERE